MGIDNKGDLQKTALTQVLKVILILFVQNKSKIGTHNILQLALRRQTI